MSNYFKGVFFRGGVIYGGVFFEHTSGLIFSKLLGQRSNVGVFKLITPFVMKEKDKQESSLRGSCGRRNDFALYYVLLWTH